MSKKNKSAVAIQVLDGDVIITEAGLEYAIGVISAVTLMRQANVDLAKLANEHDRNEITLARVLGDQRAAQIDADADMAEAFLANRREERDAAERQANADRIEEARQFDASMARAEQEHAELKQRTELFAEALRQQQQEWNANRS